MPPGRGRERERELARMRMQRRAARQAAARARRRNAVLGASVATAVVIALVAVIAIAVNRSPHKSTNSLAAKKSTPSASPSRQPFGVCSYIPVPKTAPNSIRDVGLPTGGKVDTVTPYVATIKLNAGTVKVNLLTSKAPCTVNSFAFLASKHYFDKTPCHRLTTAGGLFVLQCGDPTGTGSGGPGYQFDDENLTGATYKAGTVAMANAGPGTNGSQFFIVYKDSQLPPNYTPFGRVVGGLDVVQAIAKAGSVPTGDGKPKKPVTIESFTVDKA